MTTTPSTNDEIKRALQEAILFGINRGAAVERRKQFPRYAFLLLSGVIIGVLVHAIGASL